MTHISRRAFVQNAAKAGLALGAGGLAAACGSSSPSATASGGAKPKRGGTLHLGVTGGGSADTLDPNKALTNADWARVPNLYDPLITINATGQTQLWLADEITPNKDATVWTIRVRDGVTFHNGKTVTADDLLYSFQRAINPKAPMSIATILNGRGIHASGMRKIDSRTISVPFAKPYSTFLEVMATVDSPYVVPPGFNPSAPIGTGPFKYKSFTPGQQSVFVRNESYWMQPLPYADTLIMTDYADETSQVNALLSNEVNLVNLLSQDVVGTVTGSGKNVVISLGGGFVPFTMRVDMAPFTDVRVRQAFRYAVDRQKMLDTVFGGHGTIGNDLYSIFDSTMYDHGIPQRPYDPEKAKSLLKAAGHDRLSIELVTGDIAQGATNMAQVYAQQAAASNIDVTVRTLPITEYEGPMFLKWTFAQDFWYYQPYFGQAANGSIITAPYNETHFANSRYNSLYEQAQATLNTSMRAEIAHEMQAIEYNEGGYIIPFFPPVIDGYAPNVNGVLKSREGASFNNWDFKHMWLS